MTSVVEFFKQSDEDVINTVYIVLAFFFMMIIGVVLYFAFMHSNSAFISTFSMIIIIYSFLNITYRYILRDNYDTNQFRVLFGSDLFVAILTLFVMFYFATKDFMSSRKMTTSSY
jgi:hypothetical protein